MIRKLGIRLRKGIEGMKGKWDAFPWIKQKDQMDCGPACLRMFLSFYKLPIPSTGELNSICQVSRQGVSVAHLSLAAKHLGFQVEAVKTGREDICEQQEPILLLLNTGHFVVHYAFRNGYHCIADPAVGLLQVSPSELISLWYFQEEDRGLGLFLHPPREVKYSVSCAQKSAPFWKPFFSYIPLFKPQLVWLFTCFLCSGFFALLLPILFQVIVDVSVAQKNWSILLIFVLAQLVLYIGQLASEIVRTWMVLGMGAFINLDRVSLFFDQLIRVKWPFFASRMLGDIMLRIDDHKRIERFLLGPAMEMLMSGIQLFFLSLVLLRSSLVAFALVVASAVFYLVWYKRFVKQRAYLDYELFRREAKHRSQLVEMIEGMQDIKLTGASQLRIRKWIDLRKNLFFTQVKSLQVEQRQNVGIAVVGACRDVCVTAWTAHLAIEGSISVGMLFSIQFVVGQMGEPIRQWVETARLGQDAQLSSLRIQDVYDEPKELSVTNKAGTLTKDKQEEAKDVYEEAGHAKEEAGHAQKETRIVFDKVSFAYPGLNSTSVLNQLQFEIGAGFYAIVGESGCGKTSLLKLLLGFYEPQAGMIRVNGQPFDSLDMAVWREQCGVVLQDGYIFSDSLLANIAPSDPTPDIEKVQHALEICCLWEWVQMQAKGIDTMVGKEGIGLSQGQRQRLLLARALYKDPSILLLDEATNALDVQTERRLWENLQPLFSQKTTLVVAHRLSTVVKAKEILVMHQGGIVERGTHTTLLEKHSFYYELVKHQLYE